MKKQKRSEPNEEIRTLFEEMKKKSNKRSVDIAIALNVSPQTVTAMSWNLDECKLTDIAKIADVFGVSRVDFIGRVLTRSKLLN